MTISPENTLVWTGVLTYVAIMGLAAVRADAWPGRGLILASLLLGAAIALRWVRLGHGPFINLYEILLSNLFSLGLLYALARIWLPRLRVADQVVLPVLLLLGAWLLFVPALDSHFPPTYETPWLWVHLLSGKLFLAAALIAAGLGGVLILRRLHLFSTEGEASDTEVERLAWWWLGTGLVFHTAMLVAGAVWAQDAWGRYWAWDPLETSAFLTWLALALALHSRLTWRIAPMTAGFLFWGVFSLAFLTFFGVPFLSQAPHQGAI
ncbi:Cytochrome c-type biogenesis protein CcsA/ResC [hydrothermal vent metagenome]|uniref:Cytochrome c-type biogenesis protein CcsA/ResC n=1 Tax=hydrothermal vent metagenome TaxID=652676 RepID=A0A3B0YDJ7_9ZZZZ